MNSLTLKRWLVGIVMFPQLDPSTREKGFYTTWVHLMLTDVHRKRLRNPPLCPKQGQVQDLHLPSSLPFGIPAACTPSGATCQIPVSSTPSCKQKGTMSAQERVPSEKRLILWTSKDQSIYNLVTWLLQVMQAFFGNQAAVHPHYSLG